MFKCDKCGWHVPVEGTQVCSLCARQEAEIFSNCVATKKPPTTLSPLHNLVWNKMVNEGRRWRVSSNYIKGCGHPYVKDTQGKCIFCRVESNEVNNLKMSKENIAENLRKSAELLRQKADEAISTALAIESGFYTPPQEAVLSKRQQAILRDDKWYDMEEPCKHCGVVSQKYVANGRCRNCGK